MVLMLLPLIHFSDLTIIAWKGPVPMHFINVQRPNSIKIDTQDIMKETTVLIEHFHIQLLGHIQTLVQAIQHQVNESRVFDVKVSLIRKKYVEQVEELLTQI